MKALSLTQPWATLVAIGAKKVETRSWATAYRGDVAIHAAKGLASVGGMSGLTELCARKFFFDALAAEADRRGLPFRALTSLKGHPLMPVGAIVAVTNLVAVKSTSFLGLPSSWLQDLTDSERAFGDYSKNRYGWFLEDVVALPEPVPCGGALSLWDVPADVELQIREQLKRVA